MTESEQIDAIKSLQQNVTNLEQSILNIEVLFKNTVNELTTKTSTYPGWNIDSKFTNKQMPTGHYQPPFHLIPQFSIDKTNYKTFQIYKDSLGLITEYTSNDCYGISHITNNFNEVHNNLKREINRICFQKGNPLVTGNNGLTNETLLAILIHRTELLDKALPCQENKNAIMNMKEALCNFITRSNRVKNESKPQGGPANSFINSKKY